MSGLVDLVAVLGGGMLGILLGLVLTLWLVPKIQARRREVSD